MTITDDRVQKMNEVLTYIKFIKMYAWVKAFSQSVQSESKDLIYVYWLLCFLSTLATGNSNVIGSKYRMFLKYPMSVMLIGILETGTHDLTS